SGQASGNPSGTVDVAGAARGQASPPMQESGFCPQCGSSNIEMFGLPSITVDIVTGQEAVEGGDVLAEAFDPMQGKLHLYAQDFDSSPYWLTKRLFLVETLQQHYPYADIQTQATHDLILLYRRALQVSNGNTNYSIFNDSEFSMMAE